MNTSRRSFLRQTSFAFAGVAFFSHPVFGAMDKKRLTGIQLYSVRDDMKKNPSGTLHALAEMGYKYVEHANYVDSKFYGYHAKDFKKLLDDLGLKMRSGHTVMRIDHWDAAKKDFTDEWKATIEDAAVVGQQFVISPWMDEKVRTSPNDLMHFLDLFNKSGELCKKSGMLFGYHNHDFEIRTKIGDETLYDVILKNTDPSLVIHQLDIGNFYGAGVNETEFMNRYASRFVSMHVKDELKMEKPVDGSEYESTVLGKGVLDVKNILKLAKKNGTEHFIIEQESYQGQNPLDAMKTDLQVMEKWGFVF